MRVPQEVRDCVVYLYEGDEVIGTGFLLGLPLEQDEGQAFLHVVTAAHVVVGRSRVVVRINSTSGKTLKIETSTALDWWVSDAEGADVAIACIRGDPRFQITLLRPDQIADNGFLEQRDVGPGDEVVFVSLFTRAPGTTRNLPIVRFGHVARMNEETTPQETSNGSRELDAILVEARSWGGHSGSPAFLVFSSTRYMGQIRGVGDAPRDNWALLGLVSGHWNLPSPIRETNTSAADPTREAMVNSGMALVVPGQQILDLLNRPDVTTRHQELLEELPT
jgi:Trypsin-like peptidase domain